MQELQDSHQTNVEVVRNYRQLLILSYKIDDTIEEPSSNSTNTELIKIAEAISDQINKKLRASQSSTIIDQFNVAAIGDTTTTHSVNADPQVCAIVGEALDNEDTISMTSRNSRISFASTNSKAPRIIPRTNKTTEARRLANLTGQQQPQQNRLRSRASSASYNIRL